MGREGNDPIAIHSSIALLQERFRQLQKVKEMREEKELLRRNLGDQGQLSRDIHHESSRLFFLHPESVFPPPPPPEVTLSLCPSLQIKQYSNFHGDEKPSLKNLQGRGELFIPTSWNKFQGSDSSDSEVDTSLHL